MADGGVRPEDPCRPLEDGVEPVQPGDDRRQVGIGDVATHAADAVDRMDDAAAGGLLEHVEDFLAHPPALHQEVLEAEGVRAQAQPQEVALDTRQLGPDEPQPAGPLGYLDRHDVLECHAVGHAVHEAADPADPLDDVAHLGVLDALHHRLEAAVDVADHRDRVDNLLVLEHEVQDEGLGQHRVLWTHRDDGLLHGCFCPCSSRPAASRRARMAPGANGTRSPIRYICPPKSTAIPVTSIPNSSRSSFSYRKEAG